MMQPFPLQSEGLDGDLQELNALGITHLLDGDSRSAFIVRKHQQGTSLKPVYINPALDNAHNLKSALFPLPRFPNTVTSAGTHEFVQWVNGASTGDRYAQHGHSWTVVVVADRWKVVCGKSDQCKTFETSAHRNNQVKRWSTASPDFAKAEDGLEELMPGKIDYTVPGSVPNASEHIQFFWATNWAATELGAMSTWSPELRHEVNQLMVDPRPTAFCWGKNRTMMYNEPYIQIVGKMHPGCMGATMEATWAEAYDVVKPMFDKALETGEATTSENSLFFLDRNGYTEEAYLTWYIIPVIGEQGYPGYSNPVYETTRQNFADRQLSTLLHFGQCVSTSKNMGDYWKQCLKGLEPNRHDIPFAALYSMSADEISVEINMDNADDITASSEGSRNVDAKTWKLEGVLGLDIVDLPSILDSDHTKESFIPSFGKVIRAGQLTMLTIAEGTFPKCLVNKARSRAFGDQCKAAFLVPIGARARGKVFGFFLIGINPRGAYESDYEHFIQLLCRQLATSAASTVLIEEETRRNNVAAQLAAKDRMRLANELAAASAQAEESETRFRRMADLAPVSLFHLNRDGTVVYANDRWFQLTGHSRDSSEPLSWHSPIHENDHELVAKEWVNILQGKPLHFEVRFDKPYEPGEIISEERVKGDTWVLVDAYAIMNEDGTVTGILGCVTDISRHKWVEAFLERRREEAVEMKRIQETFMDMTSHEMRNPLSAIILCGDSIVSAFAGVTAPSTDGFVQVSHEFVQNQIESANIIVLCAQHQKRIIDDVLTLSKLDAGLLVVTPVEVQPSKSIAQALKMFRGELAKANVTIQYILDPSYTDLQIDWVRLDPSRMLQVLINLLTNAIKFTQAQEIRKIKVTVKASIERPCSDSKGVQYIPSSKPWRDRRGQGDVNQPIFITVAVQDTGRGLSPAEKTLLFQRFSQATAKTHIEYGGSGLGLFISRQLTELQGGEIGVASEAGVGSTFAFYCESIRCAAPAKTPAPTEASWTETTSSEPVLIEATMTSDQKATSPATPDEPVAPVKHLLIVEDNLVNQRVMSKQLTQAGFEVSVANHGVEALERVRETFFWAPNAQNPTAKPLDVILCDIEMPVMDGLIFAREMRELQQTGSITGHIPIIAVSANARTEQQDSAKDAGMDGVITKPFRMAQMIRELKKTRSPDRRHDDGAGGNTSTDSHAPFGSATDGG